MKKVVCVVFAAVALAAAVGAQEQDRLYVRELLRLMEREGWSASETGALERLMLQHRWQWQITPEPEAVAFALGYARRAGLAADAAATIDLALELSLRSAEMRQLGFDARSIARAQVEAVRQTVQAAKAGGEATQTQLRDRVRDQIRLQEAEMLRDRTRSGPGAGRPEESPKGSDGGGGRGAGRQP